MPLVSCRVCRAEAEITSLFNPCKCSGSMRYVHQACLESWLAHSRTKTCEICKHEFKFIPEYAVDAPASISYSFFLSFAFKRFTNASLKLVRILNVSIVWLLVVPFFSAIFEKLCFEPMDFGGWVYSHLQPFNATRKYLLIWDLEASDIFNFILSDILEGQVIALFSLLFFILLFCLREYVIIATPIDANGRPFVPHHAGFHEEEEDWVEEEEVGVGGPVAHNVNDDLEQRIDDLAAQFLPPRDLLQEQDNEVPIPQPQNMFNHIPAPAQEPMPPLFDGDDQNIPALEQPGLEINLNLNIGEDGLAADAQVNDIGALMELFGLDGSLVSFISIVSIVMATIFLIVLLGVSLPYHVGKGVYYVGEGFDKVIVRGIDVMIEGGFEGVLGLLRWFIPGIEVGERVLEEAIVGKSVVAESVGKVFRLGSGVFSPSGPPSEVYVLGIPGAYVYCALGYLVIGSFGFYQAKIHGWIDNPYSQTLKRTVKRWSRLVMLGHKFAFFLGIELGLFPAFCGVVMDLCTLPLFSGTNFIGSRWRFACHAPFTFFLLHWFAGTICMFQLSRFVAVIRTVVRPGVIWFVRDPNDPDFQPLNEILTRTVLIQLRKLAVGTLMYTVMIVSVIGGFTIALYVLEATVGNIGYALSNGMLGGGLRVPEGVFRVLPLNWELRRESYDMAFDVVLFHAVYRIILSGLLHRALGMRLLSSWFVWSSIAFRVSEFMLGTKRQEEEDRDGGYLRVPNHDRVPVIPGLQMMVPAERGQGLFGRDGETEAEVRERWRLVYAPSRFWRRIILFVCWHWVSVVAATSVYFVIPLFVGRGLSACLPGNVLDMIGNSASGRQDVRLHDLYSFSIGLGFVAGIEKLFGSFLPGVSRVVKVLSGGLMMKRGVAETVARYNALSMWIFYNIVDYSRLVLKAGYLLASLCVFLPVVFAALVAQFNAVIGNGIVVTGLDEVLEYQHVVLGIVCVRIGYSLLLLGVWPSVGAILARAVVAGIRGADVREVSRGVGKVGMAVTSLFLMPYLVVETKNVAEHHENGTAPLGVASLKWTVAGLVGAWIVVGGGRWVRGWMQRIRDDEFLIGRRLHNVEGDGEEE